MAKDLLSSRCSFVFDASLIINTDVEHLLHALFMLIKLIRIVSCLSVLVKDAQVDLLVKHLILVLSHIDRLVSRHAVQ